MKSLLKIVYQKIHSLLPEGPAELLSDLVFRWANKPFVYLDPARQAGDRLQRGAVVFSIDFEMAWAWQYARNSRESAVDKGLRERSRIPGLLGAFNDHAIPATWATVGHLFLEKCARGSDGAAHSGMPRCGHFQNDHWSFTSGDWYQHDPCSNAMKDPAWYAPDLIEAILASGTRHEIASHSFSHLGFGPYCPPEVAEAELDACCDAMKSYGIRPTSLVYPGNDCGHIDTVAGKGFNAVRWFPVSWADIALPARLGGGLWGCHTSACLETRPRAASIARHFTHLCRYVDKAIETKMVAHVWFHPDLDSAILEDLLRPLLRYCADQREKGRLDLLTMAGLAEAMDGLGR